MLYDDFHEKEPYRDRVTKTKFTQNRQIHLTTKCANPSHLLICFFKIHYYTGLFPFKFKYCTLSNRYVLVKSWWHKVYCCFIFCMTTLDLVKWLENVLTAARENEDAMYFELSQCYGCIVLYCLFVYTMWTKPTHFEELLNEFNSNILYTIPSCENTKCIFMTKLFGFVVVISGLIFPNLHQFRVLEDCNWDFWMYVEKKAKDGASIMSIITFTKWEVTDCTRFAFFLLHVPSQYYLAFSVSACRLLLNLSAGAMIMALRSTKEKLRNSTGIEGISMYYTLKRTNELMVKTTSAAVFGVVFGSIPQMMFGILTIVRPPGMTAVLWNLFEVSITFGFIILAAIVNAEASATFEKWLRFNNNFSRFEGSYLSIFLTRVSEINIGFSAGMTKLTVSFLGSVIGMAFMMTVVLISSNITQKN